MIIDISVVMAQKRTFWSNESKRAAMESVSEGKGLREAARLYNVPVETLRRVTGKVDIEKERRKRERTKAKKES